MSKTIWLSTNLSRVAKSEGFEVDGGTVGECIEDLICMVPAMRNALFYGPRLDPKIEVQVNKKTVDGAECLTKNVKDGDEIRMVLRGH